MASGETEPTSEEASGVPANSTFGEGANAAAEANWDTNNDLSASQEWVEVPRDAAETDTGVTATPAANTNTQSWADDQPEAPTNVCVLAHSTAPSMPQIPKHLLTTLCRLLLLLQLTPTPMMDFMKLAVLVAAANTVAEVVEVMATVVEGIEVMDNIAGVVEVVPAEEVLVPQEESHRRLRLRGH
jgi:hypothetical protein